jgi:signal transduction histidine kinase
LTFDTEKCLVYADKAAIGRVLSNLTDNAVKFADEGGEIHISVKTVGKKAEISVANTGAVIAAADQKRVWERFYKTDKSRTQDKKGVGLGLFIVKNIISRHGQNITLQSGDNRTVFTFWLPLA